MSACLSSARKDNTESVSTSVCNSDSIGESHELLPLEKVKSKV